MGKSQERDDRRIQIRIHGLFEIKACSPASVSAIQRVPKRIDFLDNVRIRVLRITPKQVTRKGVREGGENPPRARRCNRGRKPQGPLSSKDGKARQVERAGSQKTCLQNKDSFGLCAVQPKLNAP